MRQRITDIAISTAITLMACFAIRHFWAVAVADATAKACGVG
jgi:hypothetical protein